MPEIKLIGCDMDGTFFPSHDTAPQANIDAVKEAQAKGIVVCPCTTRNYVAGKRMFGIGDFDEYAVICNGGAIINRHTLEKIHSTPIPVDKIRRLTELCDEHNLSCGVFSTQKLLAYMPTFEGGFNELFAMEAPADERYIYCDDIDALCEAAEGDALLFFIISNQAGDIQIPQAFFDGLNELGGLDVTRSNPAVCEILAQGVSKAAALAKLADILGIERENVMALGDNHNDAPMVEWAGYGVAMGGGVDECKQVADVVGDLAENGAVGKAIREIL